MKGRLEFRGTQAIFYPEDGGVWFLTRSQLVEYRRTGELKPFSDPGWEGLRPSRGEVLVRTDAPDIRRAQVEGMREAGASEDEIWFVLGGGA